MIRAAGGAVVVAVLVAGCGQSSESHEAGLDTRCASAETAAEEAFDNADVIARALIREATEWDGADPAALNDEDWGVLFLPFGERFTYLMGDDAEVARADWEAREHSWRERQEEARRFVRTGLRVLVNEPECFDPGDVAAAEENLARW